MAVQAKKQGLIKWQLPMQRVLYALTPPVLASIHFFGLRSLVLLAVVNAAGFLTEFIFSRYNKEPVSSAVFVTNFLFTLTLPPTLPVWIAAVGIVFAVIFGKMVFGGFGRNVFNPALVGRAFIYVSFGVPMTTHWVEPFKLLPGGFASFASDALSGATPLRQLAAGETVPRLSLLLGNVSGSLGETCAVLIVLGGLYIVWKKAANYRIVLSCLAAMLLAQAVFWLAGLRGAGDPLSALLSGGFLLGSFFMATDPVSAAQTNGGRWIFGTFIGLLTVLIRLFSVWAEGMMFAILLGNIFAPILDYAIRQRKSKRAEA